MEELQDLTSVNIMMQKQQLIETQLIVKSQQMTELESQAQHLARMEPEKQDEIEAKKLKVGFCGYLMLKICIINNFLALFWALGSVSFSSL